MTTTPTTTTTVTVEERTPDAVIGTLVTELGGALGCC